jgi:AcrR family transcriptional regulator
MSKTSKEELQREALRFFILHDYEKSSLNDIARALGVTKGAIYHHFRGGKDDLLFGAVNYMFDSMDAFFSRGYPSDLSLKTILQNLFQMREMMKEVGRMIGLDNMLEDYGNTIYLVILTIRKFPEFQLRMKQIYDSYRLNLKNLLNEAIVRGEIRRDVDCEAVAYEITAFYEGSLLMGAVTDSREFLDLGSRVCHSIWIGIASENKKEEHDG